jgi:metallophosphoesterase (TIGR00282 family)
MQILFIGDVVGRLGRKLVTDFLAEFRREHEVDFVIANAENAAGGKGLTPSTAKQLFDAGVDVLTGGNHTWKNREIFNIIDEDPRILRPANYPPDLKVPGRGSGLYRTRTVGVEVGVINLQGRVFMAPIDCPFRVGRSLAEELGEQTPLLIVDIHAEATSEKWALAWHLDGLVTAVVGTHTHVPTADETISAAGTARLVSTETTPSRTSTNPPSI